MTFNLHLAGSTEKGAHARLSQSVIEVEATPPPALSDEARYVELDMLIASDGDMVKHKALPTALQLGGNVGIHLFRRANDDAVKSKLQRKRANLRIKLELDLFEELDSDKHAKGMKELKEHVLRRLHYQVEQQIFKRKLILVEKEQVDSGNQSINQSLQFILPT